MSDRATGLQPMNQHEAVTIVLQLAEAKWIQRARRKVFRLSDEQEHAIKIVSQMVESKVVYGPDARIADEMMVAFRHAFEDPEGGGEACEFCGLTRLHGVHVCPPPPIHKGREPMSEKTIDISEILSLHAVWLADNEQGARADLSGANLRGANLRAADLRGANLRGADLRWADLRWADLSWADLSWADLRRADLRRADLREADLRRANLGGANLGGADLREVDFRRANLRRANLRGADLGGCIGLPITREVSDE